MKALRFTPTAGMRTQENSLIFTWLLSLTYLSYPSVTVGLLVQELSYFMVLLVGYQSGVTVTRYWRIGNPIRN